MATTCASWGLGECCAVRYSAMGQCMPCVSSHQACDEQERELLRAQLALLAAKFEVLTAQMDGAIADLSRLVSSSSYPRQALERGSYTICAGVIRSQLRKAENEEYVQVTPHASCRVGEAKAPVDLDLPILAVPLA